MIAVKTLFSRPRSAADAVTSPWRNVELVVVSHLNHAFALAR